MTNVEKIMTAPTDITPIGQEFDFKGQVEKLKSVKFPKSGIGKDQRSFQLQWVDRFSWIEYSINREAIFCHICRQFGNKNEQQFTTIGFNTWRTALSNGKGLCKHNASTEHITAAAQYIEKLKRIESGSSVSELVNANVLQKRRYYCKSIIEVILFLSSNRLAFRGDWNEEDGEETGLFNSLFEFALKRDPELVKCQQNMPKNATYKSPLIQNEFIRIIAHQLRKKIVDEVMNADTPAFTALFDGTKDLKGDECVSMAARFVYKGVPTEALIFFETTENVDAEAFTKLLLDSLKSYGIDPTRIISQCYDGAPVMNGYKSGVQKRLQDELNKTIPYVHCFNHKLRLVIVSTIKQINPVKELFDQIQLIYSTFKKPKIKKIYEGSAVKRLIDTRWTGHYQSTKAVLANYTEIVSALKYVQDDKRNSLKLDGDDIAICIGILNIITKKKFAFLLIFMDELLSALAPADTIFQKREISYRRAIPVLEAVKTTVGEYRDPEGFDQLMEKTNALMGTIPVVVRPARRIQRRRSTMLRDFVVEETLGERSDDDDSIKSCFFEIIDVTLMEFDKRFTENDEILLALSSSDEMQLNNLKPLEQLGLKLPAEHELRTAKIYLEKKKNEFSESVNGNDSRFNVLATLFDMREVFPDVYSLYAAIETFGCSTAVCEASFSALSQINIPKRVSMSNERMRNLAFLAFESKRLKTISIDDVLKEWNCSKARKIQLF